MFWDNLLYAVMGGIWKERNRRVFEEKYNSREEVIDSIVRELGNWLLVLKKFQGFPLSLFIQDWATSLNESITRKSI